MRSVRPPTTPPTIGPYFMDLLLEESVLLEFTEDVVDVDEELLLSLGEEVADAGGLDVVDEEKERDRVVVYGPVGVAA